MDLRFFYHERRCITQRLRGSPLYVFLLTTNQGIFHDLSPRVSIVLTACCYDVYNRVSKLFHCLLIFNWLFLKLWSSMVDISLAWSLPSLRMYVTSLLLWKYLRVSLTTKLMIKILHIMHMKVLFCISHLSLKSNLIDFGKSVFRDGTVEWVCSFVLFFLVCSLLKNSCDFMLYTFWNNIVIMACIGWLHMHT